MEARSEHSATCTDRHSARSVPPLVAAVGSVPASARRRFQQCAAVSAVCATVSLPEVFNGDFALISTVFRQSSDSRRCPAVHAMPGYALVCLRPRCAHAKLRPQSAMPGWLLAVPSQSDHCADEWQSKQTGGKDSQPASIEQRWWNQAPHLQSRSPTPSSWSFWHVSPQT